MSRIAILFGAALILVGVIGYVVGNFVSITALIPAFIGIVLVLMGYIAKAKDNLRQHVMHVAVLVALLGFIGTCVRWIPALKSFFLTGAVKNNAAFISQTLTALLCLIFVILCVKSFIDARRNRTI